MSERKNYNRIIGVLRQTKEVLVLEDTFRYSENFTGATSYRMEVLTKDQAEDRNTDEALRDWWQEAVASRHCDKGLDDWLDDARAEAEAEGLHFVGDDPSFRAEFDEALAKLTEEQRQQLKEATGVDEQFLAWFNVGCGRCIDANLTSKDFSLLLDPQALDIAIKAEKGIFDTKI